MSMLQISSSMKSSTKATYSLLTNSKIPQQRAFYSGTALFNTTRRTSNSNQHRRSATNPVVADMFAGLKRALQGTAANNGSTSTMEAKNFSLFFADNAPSWDELQAMVDAKQKELGLSPPDLENGPSTAASLKRTFGQPGEPRIKLYRDHAAWCPYCHKIVLQLEEKRIPYTIEKINMRCYGDKPKEFMQKVPSGLLPVLEIDGNVYTESAVIQQLLEQLYPSTPMLPPPDTPERERAAKLMRLERRLFSDWLQWLCNGWGNDSNKAQFINTMDVIDAELGATPGPYFLENFGLVDITFAPFLERIAASIAYYKGFMVRGENKWPNVENWFNAMEGREPYIGFRSDYYTHVHDLPPQLGGCISVPGSEAAAAAIDGTDGKSWHLPLSGLSTTGIEPFSPGDNPEVDRYRAAAKLVGNHKAVVPFSLRAVGERGPRPVSAALCDPTAIPGMEYEAHADGALRHVAHALLVGVESKETSTNPLQVVSGGGELDGVVAAACLGYARDRVCVPRDLPFPSARQFRAHMNYFIDRLQG